VIDGLALAGLLAHLPKIVQRLNAVALIHHPLAEETGIHAERAIRLEAAERAALALVSRVIVTSPWTRRRLADYGVAPERVLVVEPGVDRGAPRAREPSPGVRLLTVATITPRKGHDLLVEALARLRNLDWSLRCAGSLEHDRRHAEKLQALIEKNGMGERIRLLGELSPGQVCDEYASADLFVLPSYLEGYGMALAEAIAHGLPVISTTAGAIPDTVPKAASRLVAPGDIDALTEALREVIDDAAVRGRLVRSARAAAATLPSWAEAGRTFAAALRRCQAP
jgi:glycosyltransferase involved in cell wall biosynthesis